MSSRLGPGTIATRGLERNSLVRVRVLRSGDVPHGGSMPGGGGSLINDGMKQAFRWE
ncbi:C6 finger domain protein [Aspergillus luchuensis]|uniref:C6 finger domain protein n=1 Tax=Aspergillus kawachii TaxID=1069201 RepID=A0A146F0C0_ASPKA|nr:C6 finger domain protein [Aspergillus luchuensis]